VVGSPERWRGGPSTFNLQMVSTGEWADRWAGWGGGSLCSRPSARSRRNPLALLALKGEVNRRTTSEASGGDGGAQDGPAQPALRWNRPATWRVKGRCSVRAHSHSVGAEAAT